MTVFQNVRAPVASGWAVLHQWGAAGVSGTMPGDKMRSFGKLYHSQILVIAVRIFINEQGTAPKGGMNFNSLRVGSELT